MDEFNRFSATVLDLERGPLLLFRLVRVGIDDYRLLRVHHHIISDGPSWKIYFDELSGLYEAAKCGKPSPLSAQPALQYVDYADWQRKHFAAGEDNLHDCIDWWEQNIDNASKI